MAYEDTTTVTQLTSITTEQFFDDIEASPGETITIHVNVDFPGSPTDDAIVSVYPGMGATDVYADVPIETFRIDNADDGLWFPLYLVGYRHYRIGVQRTGSTDTLTSADLRYEGDGVDA